MSGRRFSGLLCGAVTALLLLLPPPAHAVDPGERLADPALEARARALGKELRCPVCQSESIDDFNADLSHDLRVLVREKLKQGYSDAQIIAYLRARYGDFILLNPPVEPATYFLWFGPAAALLAAGGGIAFAIRRRRGLLAGPPPLAPEEQRRLESLLAEDGEGTI